MIEKRLTAEEVAGKRFTPVRLREGYSMDEVDAFLDEVESTLTGQEAEVKELQGQVRAATEAPKTKPGSGVSGAEQAALAELAQARLRIQQLEKEVERARNSPTPDASPAPAAAPAEAPGQSIAEASSAVGRMIEMAARQHDDLIEQGKTASEKLVSDAKAEATRLLDENQAKIREERNRLEGERSRQLGQLETERAGLEKAIEQLRQIENQSRNALGAHYTARLEELKNTLVPAPGAGGVPTPPKAEVKVEEKAPPAAEKATPEVEKNETPEADEAKPEGEQPHSQHFPSFFGNPE